METITKKIVYHEYKLFVSENRCGTKSANFEMNSLAATST